MINKKTVVIIGAGIAGVNAAEALRNEGHKGRIILLDGDNQMPYDRPPLSKEFMIGESSEEDIRLHTSNSFKNLDIELKLGIKITDIDLERKLLVSSEGEEIEWEKLLLATGSNLRELKVEGSHLNGIFYLKKFADADAIRQKLNDIQQITIVGAGFIGAELASSFRKLGKKVTVIERAPLPLAHILGDQIGEYFLQLHRDNGVEMIIEDAVVKFEGQDRVEKVITEKGETISSQAVIIGIGVIPNTSISHKELETDRGYIVNEYGETSLPDVYAAGDCSFWPYRGQNVHVEHWDHAVNHGKCVAKNMFSYESTPYTAVPYFWSDQYNHRIQYFGHTKEWETTVLRGNMEEKSFSYFYLDNNGIITAALLVNQPKNALSVRRLIKQPQPVDLKMLSNPDINLKEVVLKTNQT